MSDKKQRIEYRIEVYEFAKTFLEKKCGSSDDSQSKRIAAKAALIAEKDKFGEGDE